MARQKLFTPVKIPKARFLVFTQSCTSVMPVTQDHFYSTNATEDHEISYYIMRNTTQFDNLTGEFREAY